MISGHKFQIINIKFLFLKDQKNEKNSLPNLSYEWWDIENIYFSVKDLEEWKHRYLKNKWKEVGIKHFNAPNAFI